MPEEQLRHRLVGTYYFMDCSGLYLMCAAVHDPVETICGQSMVHVRSQCAVLSILVGGLDLAALHAFVGMNYRIRLTMQEVVFFAVAACIGVAYGAQPEIIRATSEFFKELIKGPWSLITFFDSVCHLPVCAGRASCKRLPILHVALCPMVTFMPCNRDAHVSYMVPVSEARH